MHPSELLEGTDKDAPPPPPMHFTALAPLEQITNEQTNSLGETSTEWQASHFPFLRCPK